MKNSRTDSVKKIRSGVDDTFTITTQHTQYNMYTHSITYNKMCTNNSTHTDTHMDILHSNT